MTLYAIAFSHSLTGMALRLASRKLYRSKEKAQSDCDKVNKDYPVFVSDTAEIISLEVEE